MPIVRTSVNNLIGGVSQQSPSVRLINQCEAMENAWPSPVDGLTKRQPTQFIGALAANEDGWKYHWINRSSTERYLIIFKPDGILAFNVLTGASIPVALTDGGYSYSYLSAGASKAKDTIEAVTAADYTFVLNKTKTPAMLTGLGNTSPSTPPISASADGEAYIFIKAGNYQTRYGMRIKIGATEYTYSFKTWDGNTAIAGSSETPNAANTELNSIRTDDIAEQLRLGILAMGFGATLAAVRADGLVGHGSIVRLAVTSASTPFAAVEPFDSVGDSSLLVIWREAPRVAGYLPEICTNGFRVKVVGDAEIDADDYYVKFRADGGGTSFTRGVWEEDLPYNHEYKIDPTTMPHVLRRIWVSGNPEFRWEKAPWADKLVGDSASNPTPSFVGKTLNNVFLYKERLGVLSDDRVFMTETGEYFNLWRTTTLVLEDTAPIDVTVAHSPVSILKYAIPFNESLFLKGVGTQFILRGGDILSPRTVQIIPASAFENYEDRAPVSSGRSIFFSFKRGQQSGVREFFQLGEGDAYDAADITVQVPNYISGEIEHMACSTLEDTLVCLGKTALNHLYVYKYLWNGSDRAQAAWGKWVFESGYEVRSFAFIDNSLYIALKHPASANAVALERLEVATGLTEAASSYVTLLDHRVTNTQVTEAYDAFTDRTTITLPFVPNLTSMSVVEVDTGFSFPVLSVSQLTLQISVRSDITAKSYYVGCGYAMRYEFTKPLLRPTTNEGTRVAASGTVQKVKRLDIEYHDSGPFKATCRVGSRDTFAYELGSILLDQGSSAPQSGVVLKTASEDIPVYGRANETVVTLVNDGPYPSNVTSAQWTLLTFEKGPRLP